MLFIKRQISCSFGKWFCRVADKYQMGTYFFGSYFFLLKHVEIFFYEKDIVPSRISVSLASLI